MMRLSTRAVLGCFLIVSFGFVVTAQQRQEQQQPSLEETLKWLSEKLENDGGYVEGNTSERIDLIDLQGCTVNYRWTHQEVFSGVSVGVRISVTFPLNAIDQETIKT